MSTTDLEGILLALRLIAGLLLMAFLVTIFVMLWRDLRAISSEVQSRTRRHGRLVVISARGDATPAPGSVFPLLPLTSMGRSASNTIVVNDAFASNEHALVTLRDGNWWLEDRASSNGTLLNDYRIEEAVVLSSGDIIGLGRIELKLELD